MDHRLVYRASRVLHQPLEELSFLLGFEVPPTPLISLAGLKADGAIIHWSLPEKPRQKKELKYGLQLNGCLVGKVSAYESAVVITGLHPETFYIVRVALINSHEFSTKSAPIRFVTKPTASGQFFLPQDAHETDAEALHESVPRIRPYRALKDIAPASPGSVPMAREGSTGLAPRKISHRRPSPATLGLADKHDPQPDDGEAPEGAESIQQLTEKLDAIRRETDEIDRQTKDEEEEELRQHEELIKERDRLRAEQNEKDKTSRSLKREVNNMERYNTAAQNERSKMEKARQQKMQERQKFRNDILRWEREAEEMKAGSERLKVDMEESAKKVAEEHAASRARLAEEQAKVKALEEEAKEQTGQIKQLERALKSSTPDESSEEPNLVQQMQADAEDERQWQAHMNGLRVQYAEAFTRVEAAKKFHIEQMRYLDALRDQRRQQEEAVQYVSPPPTQERLPRRADSQRSRHATNRNSMTDSPRLASFPPPSQTLFTSNMNSASSGFGSTSFFNIHNGAFPHPTEEAGLSDEERDRLTGGAMMSPGAGAELIPADLFNGDDNNRRELVQPLPGLGALPGLAGLPGPTNAGSPSERPGPESRTVSSRSPSVFASPLASQHNLHIGSPEGVMDADGRSIRSTRSNRAISGGTGSRFGGMFGIKQRSKNLSEDGPPLSKANSMPRQDQGLMGLDSATRKRNSSISGSVFQSQLEGSFDGTSNSPATAPGRRAFGLFSKDRGGGWPSSFAAFGRRPTSPRPGSTHSNELPRPSFDSTRWGVEGWPSSDASAGARNSPLGIGPGWNMPNTSQTRLYGSRHPSRRPSVQYPTSGPPEDIMEDEDDEILDDEDKAPHASSDRDETISKFEESRRYYRQS